MPLAEKEQTMAMAGSSSLSEFGAARSLLDAAHRAIYEQNLFRVLGVPIETTDTDLIERADKLSLHASVAPDSVAEIYHAAFGLSPVPSKEQIEDAKCRMDENGHRLVDEFFWFWPLHEESSDPAMQAILNGDGDKAERLWKAWEDDSDKNFIAYHNLAILHHLRALDGTTAHIARNPSSAGNERDWKTALSYWEKVQNDDRIWSEMTRRVLDKAYPGMDEKFAGGLRRTLPKALGLINGEVAIAYVNAGNIDLAKKHIAFVRETNSYNTNLVFDESVISVKEKLKVAIKRAQGVAGNEATAKDALQAAKQLLDEDFEKKARPVLDLFFPDKTNLDGTIKIESHKTDLYDEVASAVLFCCAAYFNAMKGHIRRDDLIDLLQNALKITTAFQSRKDILDVVKKLDPNADIGSNTNTGSGGNTGGGGGSGGSGGTGGGEKSDLQRQLEKLLNPNTGTDTDTDEDMDGGGGGGGGGDGDTDGGEKSDLQTQLRKLLNPDADTETNTDTDTDTDTDGDTDGGGGGSGGGESGGGGGGGDQSGSRKNGSLEDQLREQFNKSGAGTNGGSEQSGSRTSGSPSLASPPQSPPSPAPQSSKRAPFTGPWWFLWTPFAYAVAIAGFCSVLLPGVVDADEMPREILHVEGVLDVLSWYHLAFQCLYNHFPYVTGGVFFLSFWLSYRLLISARFGVTFRFFMHTTPIVMALVAIAVALFGNPLPPWQLLRISYLASLLWQGIGVLALIGCAAEDKKKT